ncbi:MAG: glycosyltransferase family 9 protein [Bacteroidota bacterium]
MLRSLERAFKRSLAALLRLLLNPRRRHAFAPGPSPRILVIRQHNQLGDMLCVVPLLRALRARYAASFIALMASPVNHAVMQNLRYINELLSYDKRQFIGKEGGNLLRFIPYVRSLREMHFDIAVVPSTVSTSFTSDMLAYLSGARIRIGAGSIDGKENPSAFFFTHPRFLDWRGRPGYHQVQRNIDIWPEPLPPTDPSLEITLSGHKIGEGKSFVSNVKAGRARAIVYHPGAGKPPNKWPASRFAQVAEELSRSEDSVVVITSGPMDALATQEMINGLSVGYHLVQNEPVRRVAAILKFADLLITNDTGIMHIGAGVGTPVLSLFGPTDPEQWAPIGARHRYLRGEGGDIAEIPVDDVLSNARDMLRAGA